MIQGRRVTLRPIEEEDAPVVTRWQNQPEIWWSMDYERPWSLQGVREDLERSRAEGHSFVIEADGRPVGRIGLDRFRRRDRICSLYLYIGEPDSWGRGHARDALMALLAHAFDRMDLARVEALTLAANTRGVRVYERCGFRRDATLPERSFKDGSYVDHVVLSVTRDDFAEALDRWRAGGDPVEPSHADSQAP
jgi:RimJ/RimL family protein N-acetyltransferase